MTRAEQARQTRAQITEVAVRLFADQGYDATSLQDIADQLGLTKPAVYYHFKGKAEILRHLAQPFRQAVDDLLARARTLPVGTQRTDLVVRTLTDLFAGRQDFARIAGQQPAMRVDIQDALGGAQMLEQVIEALFGDQPSVEQRFAIYSGTAFGRALWALPDVPADELRVLIERALRRLAAIS